MVRSYHKGSVVGIRVRGEERLLVQLTETKICVIYGEYAICVGVATCEVILISTFSAKKL